jgi:hypothetical protein
MDRDRAIEEDILRRLTPRQKLDVMQVLLRQAVELKAAWIRSTHPELTKAEAEARARALVAGGPT